VARVPAFPGRNLRPAACAAALAAALVLIAPPETAEAFELVSVETRREGPDYLLRIEALFDAPPARLLAVLTDYDRIHELHPRMKVSRSLGPVGDDAVEVYSHFEGCVLLFCRDIHRVEHIRAHANTLVAVDVPGRGSFSEGRTEWHFSVDGTGSRLHYETRFVPAFRIAPLIGPGVLARSVERMTLETMAEADKRAVQGDD
jgi:hypothetical protein